MRKISDIIFVSVIMTVFVAGFIRTVFFPKDVNYYENRPSDKIQNLTVDSFTSTDFQDSVESAFSDQIPLAQKLKKTYNDINSYYIKMMTKPLEDAKRDKYMELMGMKLFDGQYFCNIAYELENFQANIDMRLENINGIVNAHKDVEFYGYYVEKDVDLNFETGKRFGAYEYIKDRIAIENFGRFHIDSFETYKKYFFKTDHHWNAKGSYKAYTQLLPLMGIDESPLKPSGTKILTETFSGANAKGKGISGYVERLQVNLFDYTPKAVYYYGQQQKDYGLSDTDFTYGGWYGADLGELVFTNNDETKPNILVIGDSFDNAVLRLLSAHCNKLCSIDLRYNKDFELSSYLEQHKIDKVLIIGSSNVFWAKDFNVEDKTV